MSIKVSLLDAIRRQFITETEDARFYINVVTREVDKELQKFGLKTFLVIPKSGEDNYYVLVSNKGIESSYPGAKELLEAVAKLVRGKKQ